MQELFSKTITKSKTHHRYYKNCLFLIRSFYLANKYFFLSFHSNFNIIQISLNYEIEKNWLKASLAELELIHSKIKGKKPIQSLDKAVATSVADDRQAKNIKQEAMLCLEATLFKLFTASRDPYWLNLIFI